MARTIAELTKGSRITDYISLGVIAKFFPLERIDKVFASTGKASKRQRNLPGHVVVYYVIALALYMQVSYREVLRCLLEGVRWFQGPNADIKVTWKSGILQARKRVGAGPLQVLHDELVVLIAVRGNKRTIKVLPIQLKCIRYMTSSFISIIIN